jgi:hypothetical protein
MKISVYTAIKNGLSNDLHPLAMLKHHLPLADEIIVNEGYSVDGTYEAIRSLDPKIKIFRSVWETPKDEAWCIGFKDFARRKATGDWCIHLDSDEFIPEWEFSIIRNRLQSTDKIMHSVEFLNFYANYKVLHAFPEKSNWPPRKMIIHRNLPNIEFWGDGSNIRIAGSDFSWDDGPSLCSVHHMGMIRDPAVLREKWWTQGRAMAGKGGGFKPPRFLFKLFPHDWKDPEFIDYLRVYEGPFINAVIADPEEFVRDKWSLYKHIKDNGASANDMTAGS